jgi:hypothetical protein
MGATTHHPAAIRLDGKSGRPGCHHDRPWGAADCFGSFLPWLTATAPFVGTISVNGMQGGDGVITLVLGVITILIGVTRLTATKMPARLWRSSIVTGVITGALAIYDYNQVQERITGAKTAAKATGDLPFDIPVVANVGTGIWALFVGAALAILGGMLVRKIPTS